MRTGKRIILETFVVLAVGVTVAVAGNAFSDQSLEWTRDYFKKTSPIKVDNADSAVTPTAAVPVAPMPESPPAVADTSAGEAPETDEGHIEHEYQSINLEGVRAALEDPRHEQGFIVFVDARADEPFEAGHIPGAVQCDHYRLDKYIGAVMPKVQVAEQVIVYCNGGQCEDSIYMCQNLMERGLDYNALFLYEGGWKEYEKSGLPIAQGREE